MQGKSLKNIIFCISVLIFISCGLSIIDPSIYQDGVWVNAQWLGQDVVTLFMALPGLLVSYLKARRKNLWKWQMVLCGVLFYLAYTYTFYAIVAELTFLYLFHFPIFGLSVMGLFIGLSHLFQNKIGIAEPHKALKLGVSLFFISISLMLVYLWLSDVFLHLTLPGHESNTPDGKPALIIYSLDLGLVVPIMIAAVMGMWRKRSFGYKLTGVMLTKTAIMGFALLGMSFSMYLKKISLDYGLIFLWCSIGILGTALTIVYLRRLERIQKWTNARSSDYS